MIKKLLIVLFVLGFAGIAMGVQWTVGGFELSPPGTESLGLADDRQRETKDQVRHRAETEHCWGTGGKAGDSCDAATSPGSNFADNGRHREGSARAFFDATEPATLDVTDYEYGGAAGDNTLDDGRLWVDSDDNNRLWVHDAAFELVTADDEVLAGAYNLIYNGSFEAAGEDGDPASACAPCPTGDADLPGGWEVVVNNGVDLDYDNPSGDVLYGDGYAVEIESAIGGGTDGIYQTLSELPNGATYKIIYRNDGDGVDDCQVTAEGAGAGVIYDSGNLNNAAWTTTEGEFTTTALEDIVISLMSVNVTDVCWWDHVAVYRIDDPEDDRPEISQPGIIALFSSSTTDDPVTNVAWEDVDGVDDLVITPPGPGWVIVVDGLISAERSTGAVPHVLYGRIEEDCGGGAVVVASSANDSGSNTGTLGNTGVPLHYINTTPVAGDTCTYYLLMQTSGNPLANLFIANGADTMSSLRVIAYPTR